VSSFSFFFYALDDFLGILTDAWVARVVAFDHVGSILEKRPWMFSEYAIPAKLVSIVVVTVAGDSLLPLNSIDLGSEGLTAETTSLQEIGPDIVILCLGA
jgi:hypothetical protein